MRAALADGIGVLGSRAVRHDELEPIMALLFSLEVGTAVISRKSTTDTFLLLNMERGDHTHSYYDRGLMAHSKIDMISIIGRYCM